MELDMFRILKVSINVLLIGFGFFLFNLVYLVEIFNEWIDYMIG